jgi:orc1/cdc6 family replication initiation protein
MIENARVLQPEFIPSEVEHRDGEINHLSHALDPITRGERAEAAFLTGPSGAGKTCIAQFALTRLRENVLDINHQYVNCWEDHSRFKTLYRILDGINETLNIHRQSTPTDVLLDRLRDYDGAPYVVILDEVDQLEDKGLLYDLYRISNLELVLIANREEELFADLGNRLSSRFSSCERIRFDQYNESELVSILEARARWGLTSGTISTPELQVIANAAAGDARTAIGILRTAARYADRDGAGRISVDLISEAVPEAKSGIHQKSLDKLNPHQRCLYEIIVEAGEITPSELYERYTEQVSDPKTKRMMRNYLSKMGHYNLIIGDGKTRGRTYQPLS